MSRVSSAAYRSWPVILCLFSTLTPAGEVVEKPLDEIVVTATRLQTTMQDTARSISVVDQQQIQDGMQQLSLDESLSGFKQGIDLTRKCQVMLDDAQQTVDQLIDVDNEASLKTFEPDA